jgi:hypothetical protein
MRYVIFPHTNIEKLPRDVEKAHIARPITRKRLEALLKKPKLKEISMPASVEKRLGAKLKKLISEKGITTKRMAFRGRAIEIEFETMLKLVELRKDERSYRKIESMTHIPKSTVHYLIKYADRAKVKKGNHIVYLK